MQQQYERQRPDMRALLDHYGVRYKDGRVEQKILCPVHEETEPSCSVNLDEGLFRCHACQAAGDGYSLIMERENIDFKAAVERAKEVLGPDGLKVRESTGSASKGIFGESRTERGGYRPRPLRGGIFGPPRP